MHNINDRALPPLFMSTYVMDAICFSFSFSSMGWKWTIQDPTPIHIFHVILWESKFHSHFYKICHKVILPIHKEIFSKKEPRLSTKANNDLMSLGRWFREVSFTYIQVFGSPSSPHILPPFVPDMLLAKEIVYQTIGDGLTKVIKDAKKTIWSSFQKFSS